MGGCVISRCLPLQSNENQGERKPQLPQNHAQVVSAATERGMEGVTFCAFQPVPAQPAIVFHVPDCWFNGAASPNIPLKPRTDAAFEFAVVGLDSSRESGSSVAQVHEHFLRLVLCQDFHLL